MVPSVVTVKKWVERFEATGSILNLKHVGPRKMVRTPEVNQAVNAAIEQSLQHSARRHATSLGLSR